MYQQYPLKIDIFSHIVPEKYGERHSKLFTTNIRVPEARVSPPGQYDLDKRFHVMDRYAPLLHVLTLTNRPAIEIYNTEKSVELAKFVNDEMAELMVKYPTRFAAAVATVPSMKNPDAALKEIDRAINDLNLRGVQIVLDIRPDSIEFEPLYQKMAQYNLPIWLHPPGLWENPEPDYPVSSLIYHAMGWPYDTTTAMIQLVFSGIFDKYPNLKFITHHCGGMLPYYWRRIAQFSRSRIPSGKWKKGLIQPECFTRPVEDYFKLFFYHDTAIYGNTPGLMCGYGFCGADHLVFGTDMPLGEPHWGDLVTRQTINAIVEMDISEEEKKKIFKDNVCRLLRLPL